MVMTNLYFLDLVFVLLQLTLVFVIPGYVQASYTSHIQAPYMIQTDSAPRERPAVQRALPSNWQNQYKSRMEYAKKSSNDQKHANDGFIDPKKDIDSHASVPSGQTAQSQQAQMEKTILTKEDARKHLIDFQREQLEFTALIQCAHVNVCKNEYHFINVQKNRLISLFNYVYLIKTYVKNIYYMYNFMDENRLKVILPANWNSVKKRLESLDTVLWQIANEYVLLGYDNVGFMKDNHRIMGVEIGDTILGDSLSELAIVLKKLKDHSKKAVNKGRQIEDALRATENCNAEFGKIMTALKGRTRGIIGFEKFDDTALQQYIEKAKVQYHEEKIGGLMHTIDPLVQNIQDWKGYINRTADSIFSDLRKRGANEILSKSITVKQRIGMIYTALSDGIYDFGSVFANIYRKSTAPVPTCNGPSQPRPLQQSQKNQPQPLKQSQQNQPQPLKQSQQNQPPRPFLPSQQFQRPQQMKSTLQVDATESRKFRTESDFMQLPEIEDESIPKELENIGLFEAYEASSEYDKTPRTGYQRFYGADHNIRYEQGNLD